MERYITSANYQNSALRQHIHNYTHASSNCGVTRAVLFKYIYVFWTTAELGSVRSAWYFRSFFLSTREIRKRAALAEKRKSCRFFSIARVLGKIASISRSLTKAERAARQKFT